ncbi:MAG: T9SS type A sorting domain-containing protein [Candidatus Lokiarchaeota archaeon]|nr:T9SS type A sorting domain-containing protein [Candidatus Lokiarchaeota archaeon]
MKFCTQGFSQGVIHKLATIYDTNQNKEVNMYSRRLICLIVAIFLALSLINPLLAHPFKKGHVFAAVGNGQFQHYDERGVLLETLDTGLGGITTGMVFDETGDFYGTNFINGSVSRFTGPSAPHYHVKLITLEPECGVESILFDAAGYIYVGQADGTKCILKYDAEGNFLQSFDVHTEDRGSDWIDLAADGRTMFYTSEGKRILRYDIIDDSQLDDFNAAPLEGEYAYALRILSDGGVLVADTESIVRLNNTGVVIQTYDVADEDHWFALTLDPDGTSFWSGGVESNNFYKFNIATGDILLGPINTGTGGVWGLTVFGEITAAILSCEVDIISPLDGAMICGDKITVNGNYKITGGLQPYAVTCEVNGVLATVTSDSKFTVTLPLKFGSNSLVMTCAVRDNAGNQVVSHDEVRVIRNSPPTATNLTITPPEPFCSENDLVGSYIYNDVDGDTETGSEIRWYKNRIHQPAFDDVLTIPSDSITCCDQWYFTVNPRDGCQFGNLETSTTVNVQTLITTEAETMKNRNPRFGNSVVDGWRITHPDRPIYADIEFPKDFLYHFKIITKGEIAHNAAPWLMVKIGNEFKGTCEITSTEWNAYYFVASISAGIHKLSLIYLNDWWIRNVDDRNLLLDRVEISCYFDSIPNHHYTFEAEDMELQHPRNWKDEDCIVLNRPYSFVGQDMYFEKDKLTFRILAKSDFVDDGWPQMKLIMDDKALAAFFVENSSLTEYQTIITGIAPGKHRIKIVYNHESWIYDRNLYIDKIVIPIQDGGLLKQEAEDITDEEAEVKIPESYALEQNYPNPFNPNTSINYQLPENSYVLIKVFNTLGKEIRTLTNEFKPAGNHNIYWDGMNNSGNRVVSGIYLYRIQAGNFSCTKKMILTR